MPDPEVNNTTTDPIPSSDLPKPEISLNQDKLSEYGSLVLAALSNDNDIKSALNPDKKLDIDTIDVMCGSRIETTAERKYNPVLNGLSVQERTEKWKDKNFDEAYSLWSTKLIKSINESDTQERKDYIVKFFGKDITDIKEEDIKITYDRYCRGSSNIDDFIKKSLESGSSSTEVEWLAKKLFGTKSGEVTKSAYEIEVELKKADSAINGIRKLKEIIWVNNLDRFNNPNDKEKEILNLLFVNFKDSNESKINISLDSDGEETKTNDEEPSTAPNTETADVPINELTSPEKSETENTDKEEDGAPPTLDTEKPSTPIIIPTEPVNQQLSKSETENTDEEENGAPTASDVVNDNTLVESPDPVAEAKPITTAQTPEPTIQPEISEPEPKQTPVEALPIDSPEPPELANEPERIVPNTEPTGTGNSWPPTDVEPVNNTATSLIQKITGIFRKK